MIKRITVESHSADFGRNYTHWDEKLTITRDKVSYIKNYYQEIPYLNKDVIGGYSKAKSEWSYGLDDESYTFVISSKQDKYIDELILIEVKKLIDNNISIEGRDMGGFSIIIEKDNDRIEYESYGSLSLIANRIDTNIIELFERLIPNGELRPMFL